MMFRIDPKAAPQKFDDALRSILRMDARSAEFQKALAGMAGQQWSDIEFRFAVKALVATSPIFQNAADPSVLHPRWRGIWPNKYVSPDEDFHRRIGKDGTIDFRTMESGERRPGVVCGKPDGQAGPLSRSRWRLHESGTSVGRKSEGDALGKGTVDNRRQAL